MKCGGQIAYSLHESTSSANKPCITLIHSLAMDRTFWSPVTSFLCGHANILTFDVRGHGESSHTDEAYTTDLLVDDLALLLNKIGWSSCAVAGESMGGCISLAFALRHPEKTLALGMIDSTAWYGEDASVQWSARADRALKEGMNALVEFQKTRWFTDQFREKNPAVVESAISIFLKNNVNSFANSCQMMGGFDLRHMLSSIQIPTTIVVGEQDFATPVAMSEIIHQSIKNSYLQIIPNAKHLTPLECPQAVSEALISLLGQVEV